MDCEFSPIKKCSKCKKIKSLGLFYKNKARYDGFCNFCIECDKSKPTNKQQQSEYNKKYNSLASTKKRIKQYRKEYYKINKSTLDEANKKWAKENPDKIRKLWRKKAAKPETKQRHRHQEAQRRCQKLSATPKWADLNKIAEFYKNCPPGYHVDHIIPLKNKNVCGFHTIDNLQYLPRLENIRKNNTFKIETVNGK